MAKKTPEPPARPAQPTLIPKYNALWPPEYTALEIEIGCVRQGGKWKSSNGKECGMGLFYHYRQMQTLMWPTEDHHRWSDLMLAEILQNTITAIAGPKDCVAGDTRILNPITGDCPTIQELCDSRTRPTVMTVGGPVVAGVPFLKGRSTIYEIVCEDGSRFKATKGHLVLSDYGFVPVSEVFPGQHLLKYDPILPESTSEPYPSIRVSGVRSFWRTPPNFQRGCRYEPSFCGVPLRHASATFQESAPSQVGVLERTPSNSHSDDLVCESLRTQTRTHGAHLSSAHSLVRDRLLGEIFCGYHFDEGTPSPESDWCLLRQRFQSAENRQLPFLKLDHDFARKQSFSCANFTVQRTKVQAINEIGEENFYDLEVPVQHHYFAEGLIHHNSSKTHTCAKYALCDYICWPECTLIIMSSTTGPDLERRVWGDVKSLWRSAKEAWGDIIPGEIIDSKKCICTDKIGDDLSIARDMRKGIACVPCRVHGGAGLTSFSGVKQKRLRLIGDEMQLMLANYLDAPASMNNGDFKGIFLANPLGDGNPFDRVSEPDTGWQGFPEPKKTTVWKNKWMNGRTINLVGTDSPNFDFPQDKDHPARYPYMVSADSIERLVSFYGTNSEQYYNKALGVRRSGAVARKIITRDICETFHAFDEADWDGGPIVKIGALDAAYGVIGGDRCIGGHIEFGNVKGRSTIIVRPPHVVPVHAGQGKPEDQIAMWILEYCTANDIPPENFFYDSTGRGALGIAIARVWSNKVNPVEFGGNATNRPLADVWIVDPKTRERRRKLCVEEYSKFVTELWFMVRLTIEADQMRWLPRDVAEDGYPREWKTMPGSGKTCAETKAEMRERTGCSPDKMDWLATAIEGARQRGFQIAKLQGSDNAAADWSWLRNRQRADAEIVRSSELVLD